MLPSDLIAAVDDGLSASDAVDALVGEACGSKKKKKRMQEADQTQKDKKQAFYNRMMKKYGDKELTDPKYKGLRKLLKRIRDK